MADSIIISTPDEPNITIIENLPTDTVIVSAPAGLSMVDMRIVDGQVIVTLSDGTEINAGEITVGSGGEGMTEEQSFRLDSTVITDKFGSPTEVGQMRLSADGTIYSSTQLPPKTVSQMVDDPRPVTLADPVNGLSAYSENLICSANDDPHDLSTFDTYVLGEQPAEQMNYGLWMFYKGENGEVSLRGTEPAEVGDVFKSKFTLKTWDENQTEIELDLYNNNTYVGPLFWAQGPINSPDISDPGEFGLPTGALFFMAPVYPAYALPMSPEQFDLLEEQLVQAIEHHRQSYSSMLGVDFQLVGTLLFTQGTPITGISIKSLKTTTIENPLVWDRIGEDDVSLTLIRRSDIEMPKPPKGVKYMGMDITSGFVFESVYDPMPRLSSTDPSIDGLNDLEIYSSSSFEAASTSPDLSTVSQSIEWPIPESSYYIPIKLSDDGRLGFEGSSYAQASDVVGWTPGYGRFFSNWAEIEAVVIFWTDDLTGQEGDRTGPGFTIRPTEIGPFNPEGQLTDASWDQLHLSFVCFAIKVTVLNNNYDTFEIGITKEQYQWDGFDTFLPGPTHNDFKYRFVRSEENSSLLKLPDLVSSLRFEETASFPDFYVNGMTKFPALDSRPTQQSMRDSMNDPNSSSTLASGAATFDKALGKPIWWNGTVWVDAMGNPT